MRAHGKRNDFPSKLGESRGSSPGESLCLKSTVSRAGVCNRRGARGL